MHNTTQTIKDNTYRLVPRAVAFIYKSDKILFIHKKKKRSFGSGKINGVGGHIERGEEPYEAIRREIREETGVIVDKLELVSILFIDIGSNPGVVLFVFKAMHKTGEAKPSNEGDVMWLSKEAAIKHALAVKDLKLLLDISEKHTSGDPPVFGKYIYDENEQLRIVI